MVTLRAMARMNKLRRCCRSTPVSLTPGAARSSAHLGCLVLLALTGCGPSSPPPYNAAACVGAPLRTAAARAHALEAGYAIIRRYDCIDRNSFESMQRAKAAGAVSKRQMAATPVAAPGAIPAQTLREARRGFTTALAQAPLPAPPLPRPPAELFVLIHYRAARNPAAPAFITPDPQDGRKHPAIIWLAGANGSSLIDFWMQGPASNDQSARAFREAGLIMMFPTLRGTRQHGGEQECFLGEVDDVLAAAEALARQPYVDAAQIYLGGHNTGATLALLAAEMSGQFAAVFAFGPVASVDRYPPAFKPEGLADHDPRELSLRSPVHWLGSITRPTYVIDGTSLVDSWGQLPRICQENTNPLVHCIAMDGEDHFSTLAKLTPVIAARLALVAEGRPFVLEADEFQVPPDSPAPPP